MVLFLGSWSALKIPQLMVEIKFLGVQFTIFRFLLTIMAFFLIGLLMDKILDKSPDQAWIKSIDDETDSKGHGRMKM
jgi:uncharacterized membrane protein YraQ (UPF0718 family)